MIPASKAEFDVVFVYAPNAPNTATARIFKQVARTVNIISNQVKVCSIFPVAIVGNGKMSLYG